MFDSQKFFAAVRRSLFGGRLSQSQVTGMMELFDAAKGRVYDPRFMAYIFATVYHETGKKMVPVREGFAKSDAGARAAVKKLFDAKRIKVNYALPNAAGVSHYGRGRVQNTWEDNYRKLEKRFKLPFVTKPDILLDGEVDAEVTVIGHLEGIWTGKKLSDYLTARKTDYVNARRIINGTDRADDIAKIAVKFEDAFREAEWPGPVGLNPFATTGAASPPLPTLAPPVPTPAPREPEVLPGGLPDRIAAPVPPTPTVTVIKAPSLWERMGEFNKAFGAARGGSTGTLVTTAAAGLGVRFGVLPDWMTEPENIGYAILVATFAAGALATAWGVWKTVTAKANTSPPVIKVEE